jgi:hypothetical protein
MAGIKWDSCQDAKHVCLERRIRKQDFSGIFASDIGIRLL